VLNEYGAMTAKVRAMYSRLMTEADWQKLISTKEIPPGFSRTAVRAQLKREYDSLCKFASREDKQFMRLFPPESKDESYYGQAFKYLAKRYNGGDKLRLISFIGVEADLLNIMNILRLHRCFPKALSSISLDKLLIPVGKKLKREFAEALRDAGSIDEALMLLEKSQWGNFFKGINPDRLERECDSFMESFCRKLIHSPLPNACIPQAYLTLKRLECERLIRVVEAIKAGIPPREVF